MPPDTVLPEGYSVLQLQEVDSTNAEALRRARAGAPEKLWICAERQSAGRGRSGRQWLSNEGNLFASLLLRPDCKLETAVQLAFVAGLAAFDAVAALDDALLPGLQLKWPNDLLLERGKLGGILLESVPSGADAASVIIGTGLNLASHPGDTASPATDLAEHGVTASTDAAFSALAYATAHWLDVWRNGAGWPRVRTEWQERSLPVGSHIRVNAGSGPLEGRLAGMDKSGALLVDTGGPSPVIITAGDVFLL